MDLNNSQIHQRDERNNSKRHLLSANKTNPKEEHEKSGHQNKPHDYGIKSTANKRALTSLNETQQKQEREKTERKDSTLTCGDRHRNRRRPVWLGKLRTHTVNERETYTHRERRDRGESADQRVLLGWADRTIARCWADCTRWRRSGSLCTRTTQKGHTSFSTVTDQNESIKLSEQEKAQNPG